MKAISLVITLSILAGTTASCNTFAPTPTETPVPTSTIPPTSTFTPEPTFTPTIKPTSTSIPPIATKSLPILTTPSGKPASNWNGFPVMPKAIAGGEEQGAYVFTIKATPDEIQRYYQKELAKTGWNLLAGGKSETGAILLIFTKGTDTLTLSIIPQPNDEMYVMLAK